jgi:hypothetical protein
MTGFWSSLCTRPRTRNVASTGTRVTESTVAPIIAKVFVNARGWKSLPSSPVREKTGKKARRMMTIEKKIGLPICREASRTISFTGFRPASAS